jgi:hypothetical protein
MKTKLIVSICVAATLAVAIALAQENKSSTQDPRIDKLIEQNAQILKNQDEILKKLDKLDQGLLQVRRRTS